MKSQIAKRILRINKLKEQGKTSKYREELEKLRLELVQQKRDIEEGIAMVNRKINAI